MGNDFDSIGLKDMNDQLDVEWFYNKHIDYVDEFVVNGEKYSILADGEGMELYFYGDSEKIWFNYCELYYTPKKAMKANGLEWIAPYGDTGINYLQVELTNLDVPCNVCVPDFYRQNHIKPKDVKEMEIICFPRYMSVYKTEEEFRARQENAMATESLIPCGTFSPSNKPDFEPDSTVLMNGIIQWVEKKQSCLGGGKFFHLGVKCLGATFEIVVEESAESEDKLIFRQGAILSGKFALVGLISK